jgi:hypothetical protein
MATLDKVKFYERLLWILPTLSIVCTLFTVGIVYGIYGDSEKTIGNSNTGNSMLTIGNSETSEFVLGMSGRTTIASVFSATSTGTISFLPTIGHIQNLTTMAEGILPATGKPKVTFPNGLFSFNIIDIVPGSTVIITTTYPIAMPTNTQYWKYQNGQWMDCTSLLGDNNGDNILILTLVDGGFGDADGIANGIIVDPGGPAIPIHKDAVWYLVDVLPYVFVGGSLVMAIASFGSGVPVAGIIMIAIAFIIAIAGTGIIQLFISLSGG